MPSPAGGRGVFAVCCAEMPANAAPVGACVTGCDCPAAGFSRRGGCGGGGGGGGGGRIGPTRFAGSFDAARCFFVCSLVCSTFDWIVTRSSGVTVLSIANANRNPGTPSIAASTCTTWNIHVANGTDLNVSPSVISRSMWTRTSMTSPTTASCMCSCSLASSDPVSTSAS